MNKEQIEELGKILVTMKNTISESEAMIEDYMQKYGVTEKIEEMINKAKEWFNK